jgi:hypothetical protein
MREARCRAKGGPAKCKDTKCPQKQAQLDSFFGEAVAEQLYSKPSRKKSGAPKAARGQMALDPHVHISQELVTDGYKKWQSAWIKAADGTPVAYLKLRVGDSRAGNGTVLYTGVTLCDIEVAPQAKGQNIPLAAFRIVKEQYGVDQIWVGDSFSETGLRMMQRMLSHEEATGEKTLAFEPHVRQERITAGPDTYKFVRNWGAMEPMYRL